ncbi:gas vesicle protein GvpO [Streptomyces sp. NBC_01591]|uniref:gas vesicle protein GvpO n=1 Tax=Streptomyces sp. NBC_01591 TaxID=2975888 RepID=UPI003FA3B66E
MRAWSETCCPSCLPEPEWADRPSNGGRTSGEACVEGGWCVVVDVLELLWFPGTTSLLATYEVQLDRDGELMGYRRIRRYRRGSADE